VHHARVIGRCENKTGIEPFGRLVDQVMSTEPYASAKTVFWIVDNGSSHAGKTSIARMEGAYANARLIHLPVHASWLNQIEIYFWILQRKALTPNDFADLNARSPPGSPRSRTTTARSPSPSSGHSLAPSSTHSWPASPTASPPAPRRVSYAANSTPPGVRATPARTATDWITLAHNNCRDQLARSTSATAASRRGHRPASRAAITARASRARTSGVSSASSTSSITASPASSSSSAIASHSRPNAGESNFGSSTCNDRSTHGRSTNSANSRANSDSLNPPASPATSRALDRKNANAKLSCDGPRATPQHRLTFNPLPHPHNSLRPIFAIGASSRQHRPEPALITRQTYGRLH
jgi:DDE superfamily endonuclease